MCTHLVAKPRTGLDFLMAWLPAFLELSDWILTGSGSATGSETSKFGLDLEGVVAASELPSLVLGYFSVRVISSVGSLASGFWRTVGGF